MPRTARRIADPFAHLPYVPLPSACPVRMAELRAASAARRALHRNKDGSQDRRYGPRRNPDYRAATSLSLADYTVGSQHAADIEDAGLEVSLEACGAVDAEVWRITDPEADVSHYVWRHKNRFGVRMRSGHPSDANGFDSVRMFRDLDAAFNHLRMMCRVRSGFHAAEATVAAAALASLPAWLTTAHG